MESTATRQNTGSTTLHSVPTNKTAVSAKPKPRTLRTKISEAWGKLGITPGVFMMMAKGAIPATLVTALMEVDAISAHFKTLGYMVTIIAALTICITPRTKLIQTTIRNALAVCFAAALCILGAWTASRGRAHNSYSSLTQYNPSAAAISAVWLFFSIYLANTVRAYNPAMAFPVIFFTIYVSVIYGYGASFTLPQTLRMSSTLLEAFMTGFAIALAVGLLCPPVLNSRNTWLTVATGYLGAGKGILAKMQTYSHDGETAPVLAAQQLHLDLYSKLAADLPNAKREVSIGHLETEYISEFYRMLRKMLLPLQSMCTMIEVHRTLSGSRSDRFNERDMAEIMEILQEPYETVGNVLSDALEHVLLVMRLKKPAKKVATDEEKCEKPAPGTPEFTAMLEKNVDQFYDNRRVELQEIFSETDFGEDPDLILRRAMTLDSAGDWDKTTQLYLVLYMEYHLFAASLSILNLVRFADRLQENGVFSRRTLIFPTKRRLKAWFDSIFTSDTDNETMDGMSDPISSCKSSVLRSDRKDPEHLPPSNGYQRHLGIYISKIGQTLGSPQSGFGLRVAVASLCVALPAFFENSVSFFNEMRMLWALIFIAIGMSPTSGASIIGFLTRVVGTAIGVTCSLIGWHIVDGRTPGVIVFLWVFLTMHYYFIIKHPRAIQAVITSMLTFIMITGYELQVLKLGEAVSESSGQPVLPINMIGAYRILVTLGGLSVAFIFTIFPYPVTTRSLIRRQTADVLSRLASLTSTSLSLTSLRIHHPSHARAIHNLEREALHMRKVIYSSLEALRQSVVFTKFEPSLRGRFPAEEYNSIITSCTTMTNQLLLLADASGTFAARVEGGWGAELSEALRGVDTMSHDTISLMVLLSAALGGPQPLPPFLRKPEKWTVLERRLKKKGALGLDNMSEKGFTAFVAVLIAGGVVGLELSNVMDRVKGLVGEVGFWDGETLGVGAPMTKREKMR